MTANPLALPPEPPQDAPESPVEPDFTVTEADIDAVIETCSGDSRAAIRALLVAQQFLHAALEDARQEASWGYVRGRPSRRMREDGAA
jgi:hypothetical protein